MERNKKFSLYIALIEKKKKLEAHRSFQNLILSLLYQLKHVKTQQIIKSALK